MRHLATLANLLLLALAAFVVVRACRDNPGLIWALAFLLAFLVGMLAFAAYTRNRACSGCIVEEMQSRPHDGRAFAFVPHSCRKSAWYYVSRDGKEHREFGREVRVREPTRAIVGRKRPKKLLTLDKPRKRLLGNSNVIHISERPSAAERRK